MTNRTRTTKVLLAAASLSLVGAACGSDAADDAVGSTDAPAETSATTDAVMEEMADEPFGPACDAVPTEGEDPSPG